MTPPPPPAATAAAQRTAAPLRLPRTPRRVSGPARPARGLRTAPPGAAPSLAGRLTRFVDAPWLDRLIRGRAWIALVAVALLGIVGMQVALLKLNNGIGRAVEQASVLQRENANLAAQVARMETSDTIRGAASKLGMVVPSPDAVTYVSASSANAGRAAQSIVPPAGGTTSAASASAATQSTAQPVTAPGTPPAAATAQTSQSAGGAAAAPAAPASSGGVGTGN